MHVIQSFRNIMMLFFVINLFNCVLVTLQPVAFLSTHFIWTVDDCNLVMFMFNHILTNTCPCHVGQWGMSQIALVVLQTMVK